MKYEKNLVSVIIPTYNCEDYITKCVESIENQTYKNIEIVICDDCSKDNTREVIKDLEKKYNNIVVLYNDKNLKAAATRNKCIEVAKGEFIAIQDADDYSALNRIEKEVDFLLKNANIDYVCAGAFIFEDDKICGKRVAQEKVLEDKDFCKGMPCIHGTALFRRSAIEKVKGYRVDKMTVRGQDFDMIVRMQINNLKGYRMSECLYYYREDVNAFKRRKFKNRFNEYKMRKMYYKQLNLTFFQRLHRFRPLFVAFIPKGVLKFYRRKKEKKNTNYADRIKVAQVLRGMDIGGIETFLMNVCRNIDKNKFQIDFIYFDTKENFYDNELRNMGINIHYVPKTKNILKHILCLRKKFKDERYDVVHGHSSWYNGVVLFSAWLARIKTRISHSHSTSDGKSNNMTRSIYRKLSKFLIYTFANRFCACGIEAGKYLYYNRKKVQDKVVILKNGIDINKFKNIDNEKVMQEFNLNNNEIILGNISRFEPVKNHEFMLNIAEELVKRNANFKMILVGDGSLIENIKQKIISKNLSNYIILPGKRTDIPELLKCFNIFILPSKYEGFPFVTVEAQAAGIPMILTENIDRNTNICEELVKYLGIEEKDVKLWCDEIEKIYLNFNYQKSNEKYLEIITDKGYNINKTIDNLVELYSK